ncbi:hypothetical protein CSC14_4024 [Proteus mirabilis]|nr:hypothetical protein CSC14_4024 [Proteus mirabilis]
MQKIAIFDINSATPIPFSFTQKDTVSHHYILAIKKPVLLNSLYRLTDKF